MTVIVRELKVTIAVQALMDRNTQGSGGPETFWPEKDIWDLGRCQWNLEPECCEVKTCTARRKGTDGNRVSILPTPPIGRCWT